MKLSELKQDPKNANVYGIVYLITNRTNGERYVGQTVRPLERRWSSHLNAAKHGDGQLQRAIRKYGRDAFKTEVVGEYETKESLNAAEQAAICAFNAHYWDGGYNLTFGADSFSNVSETTRQKMSAAKKGIVPWNKGKVTAEETRQKQRKPHRNRQTPTCEHSTRRVRGRGMCNACYLKDKRKRQN